MTMIIIAVVGTILLAAAGFFAVKKAQFYGKAKNMHPDEKKWGWYATGFWFILFVAILCVIVLWYLTAKDAIAMNRETTEQTTEEETTGDVEEDAVTETATPDTTDTASEPEEEESESEPEAALPPEQGEAYDEEYADILVTWEKDADEASRVYLPVRTADMTDEEYKGALITWLQSEELDEAFIPKDLTEEEAILYVSEFFEDFDINAVEFDRSSMPSSTTRRQRSVREAVQAYYNDPKLEGWSDAVLSSTTFDLFWEVYGTKSKHSAEWNDLVAGRTVPAETWLESYELEIEEDSLDLDGFMEYAFWQPMLYQCIHNPVYADEKAQTLLLVEKEFPGWLDNAPSVKELVELYDAAMETEDGLTDLLCKVELDNGQVMTCVRPEVVVKSINVFLAYRRLEINAANPVQAKTSTINFHLPPADGNYVRTEALTKPDEQESEPAFNLSLRYKNRKQAAELGVNVFDARDIVYIAKQPAAKQPEPTPTPTPNKPQPTPQPKSDPTPETTPQSTPQPTIQPTPTPTPEPDPTPTPPGKNPSESILDNGNEDTNDGPIDNQGGGESTPGSETNPVGDNNDGKGTGTVDVSQDTPATDVGDSPNVTGEGHTNGGEAPTEGPAAPSEKTETNVGKEVITDTSFKISDDD